MGGHLYLWSGAGFNSYCELIRARAEPFLQMATERKSFVISNDREKSCICSLNEKALKQ